jgi:hypothetical protein
MCDHYGCLFNRSGDTRSVISRLRKASVLHAFMKDVVATTSDIINREESILRSQSVRYTGSSARIRDTRGKIESIHLPFMTIATSLDAGNGNVNTRPTK